MDEYLEKLLSQIRSKKARPFIEEEIRGHIEDQIAAYAKWIGAMDQQAGTKLPDLNADYIFTYLWSEYGILAGILFCCLLGILLVLVFGAALHQKNELGFMMGCGCGTVFLTQIGLNIMINLGLFPACATSLPFLSAGGGNILLSYTLMGIVLSIYRYKNIYPSFFGRRAVSSLLR